MGSKRGKAKAKAAGKRRLGSLADRRVGRVSLDRYKLCVQRFFAWAALSQVELARSVWDLDDQLSEFVEALWADGDPVGWADDARAELRGDLLYAVPSCGRTCGITRGPEPYGLQSCAVTSCTRCRPVGALAGLQGGEPSNSLRRARTALGGDLSYAVPS